MARKSASSRAVAFFDIGGTLGRPRLSAPPVELLGIDVYPHVPPVLDELADRGIRLGIVSNTGTETAKSMDRHLADADLLRRFSKRLLVYSSVVGKRKDSPEIFELAAARANRATTPSDCVYVGEDAVEREFARQAGWRVAPHPLLVGSVIDGESLRFVQVTVPAGVGDAEWRRLVSGLPLVPLRLVGEGGRAFVAIVSDAALVGLTNAGFDVQQIGAVADPEATDLYVLRDDIAVATGPTLDGGQAADLFTGPDASLLVAAADDGLTVRVPADRSIEEFHFAVAAHGHNLKLSPDIGLLEPADVVAAVPERNLTPDEATTIGRLTDVVLGAHVDRYSGGTPLGDPPGTTITSRHILHPDNRRAVDQLASDLETIGAGAFTVSVHSFTHGGRVHYNVVAELAGREEDLVLVTAHLDSTAAFSPPYDPADDPAPGTDDDGSGVAAVLSAAAVIRDLAAATPPDRTIRFVLFNAEEHGLVGSHAYARDALAGGEHIAGVYQMDMIGYNVDPPPTSEVHAGYLASTTVQEGSVVLAERVRRLAPSVSPELGTIQLYTSTSSSNRDPAEGRSDHAAFQQRGYAAIVATEDFFAGPGATAPEPNPNYHRSTDTVIDRAYAAAIARAVTAAAWVTAAPSAATPGGGTSKVTIGSGSTTPGATAWRPYRGVGVVLDVDTSACGFTRTPRYVTSIGGRSSHWATTGATSIYDATPTGFRVYVRWSNGKPLTPAQANGYRWHINWLAVDG